MSSIKITNGSINSKVA